MKPKPFIPKVLDGNERYVRNSTDGQVWHRCRNRTLYLDTDRSQIVYHSNYLRYFELGRASLMREAAYPYKEIEENGYIYPIIEVGVKFYTPLYYDDLMWIHTRPSHIERVKLQFDYLITCADINDIVCTGFTRHCATNSRGTPVAIDQKTLHLWKTFPT